MTLTWISQRLYRLAASMCLLTLVACGHGSNTSLSPNQLAFESVELSGGSYGLSWDFPYGGGNLVSGTNYIYSTSTGGLYASPAQDGPQLQTPQFASLDPDLALPNLGSTTVLVGGNPVNRATGDKRLVSYVGPDVRVDYLADDGSTIAYSIVWSDFETEPLVGYINNSPNELQAAIPLTDWINANNFSATARWLSGAKYVKRQGVMLGDTYTAQNCTVSPDMPVAASSGAGVSCPSSGTLPSVFPIVLYGSNWPTEEYLETDGTISTVQGLPMWIANAPRSDGSYRVFYLLHGSAYTGYLVRSGTQQRFSNFDGTVTNYSITLNQAAIASISQGLITGASVAGSQQGNDNAVSIIDLFGIGGHGINGSLAPVDLRAHYNVPADLDGTGQTIAIVDGPGTGNVLDDLNTYSQYFGLPQCAAGSGCFQEIDLTNGSTTTPSNDWGQEIALDTQMVHAIAPGAKIILITSNDLMAGANYAASLPGVTAVSMSFSLFQAPSSTEPAADVLQDQLFAAAQQNNGTIFLAASGDSGNYAAYPVGAIPFSYPAVSQYVTAVGGTRINSINWNLGSASEAGWQFSGGGSATGFALPVWQVNYPGIVQNNAFRAVPDVAAVADFQHSAVSIYHQQRWLLTGGTSASTPIWAGFTAHLGQHLAQQGQSLSTLIRNTPGGLNGLLYQAALTQGAQPALIGITSGSNSLDQPNCSNCNAGPGYNDVTGLGVANLGNFLSKF